MDKKHKAIKWFYKEGAKNVGEERTRHALGLAFNRPKHKALKKVKKYTYGEHYKSMGEGNKPQWER